MVIQVSSSNLWMSPYSEYQQKIFDIIREQHEDQKMNFVQISNWLNENNYLTPRGKVFSQPLAWSMYNKKQRSLKRFSRSFEPEILNSKVEVVTTLQISLSYSDLHFVTVGSTEVHKCPKRTLLYSDDSFYL